MTHAEAERSLNRSFNYARIRADKTDEVFNLAQDVAGERRAVIPVARSPGPPIEVEVWLEGNDRVKVIWLKHRSFPHKVVTKEDTAAIRAVLDSFFDRF